MLDYDDQEYELAIERADAELARTAASDDERVEALHESGVFLRRHGSADEPLRLTMLAGRVPQPTPLVKKWWFWTGIAAVTIAGFFAVDQIIDVGPQQAVGTLR